MVGEVTATLRKRAREFGLWLKVMAVKYGKARTYVDKEGMPYICFENNRTFGISTFNECQYIPVSKSKGACLRKEYKAAVSPNTRYHKMHSWIGKKAPHFTIRCTIKTQKGSCSGSCWRTSWDKCKWKAVPVPKAKPAPASSPKKKKRIVFPPLD